MKVARLVALVVLLGVVLGLVVAMPKQAMVTGLVVAAVLTLACMLVGGMCAAVGRRMGVVSSGR